MIYKYPQNITEAAKLLDKAVPDWAIKVKDLKKSDLNNDGDGTGHLCILGKLYDDYWIGLKTLFNLTFKDWIDGINDDHKLYSRDGIFGTNASYDVWMSQISARLPKEKEYFLLGGVGVNTNWGDGYFVQTGYNEYRLLDLNGFNRMKETCFSPIKPHYVKLSELQSVFKGYGITQIFQVTPARKK